MSVAAAWWLVRFFRGAACERAKWRVRVVLAGVLFASVLADPVITYLRYADDPTLAWQLVQQTAWPFYLCDWAAIICGLALLRGSQRLAELGWCWGMGGTLQGLVYPTSLSFDLPNPDWIAFFAEHGGVPVAGVVLVLGLGLRPQPGVVWRAWICLCGYLLVAGVLNHVLIRLGFPGSNYGFVCSSDYSPFSVLGSWPQYLIYILLILGVFFCLLTWPFCGRTSVSFGAIGWNMFRGSALRNERAVSLDESH
jgi:hypothetical integral membrane protein (TIGR02206 family)